MKKFWVILGIILIVLSIFSSAYSGLEQRAFFKGITEYDSRFDGDSVLNEAENHLSNSNTAAAVGFILMTLGASLVIMNANKTSRVPA